jgi:hypothetical protein
MSRNTKSKERFKAHDRYVDDVEDFTCLGSAVATAGDTDDKVKTRVRKANALFIQLYPVWKAKEISTEKSALLYGSKTW